MSEKYRKTSKYLNNVEHLLILVLIVTGCVSISEFASLVCVPVRITSCDVGTKIYAVPAGIKTYKPIIKIKKKVPDKIMLLGKDKLNIIELLIYKNLIAYISYGKFISINKRT